MNTAALPANGNPTDRAWLPIHSAIPCPVCQSKTAPFDVIDFNRSCKPVNGKPLPLTGVAVYYHLCWECGHCFAPAMCNWPAEWFSALVYNDDYVKIDPDYAAARPDANADLIDQLFESVRHRVRHLDYGGGSGRLSTRLRDCGWDSQTWDPFMQAAASPVGPFELVTAFEVFEHIADLNQLARDLDRLTSASGLVLLSTLVSDGNIALNDRLTWWYAAPRNGHISLFSADSLKKFFHRIGFHFGSVSAGLHAAWRSPPPWLEETRFRVA